MRHAIVLFGLVLLGPAAFAERDALYIGDSITAGFGVEEGAAYPDLLEGVNLGVGGSSVGWWVDGFLSPPRLETEALPHLPARTVYVALGVNDSLGRFTGGAPTEPGVFQERMARLVDWLLDRGAGRVVLLGEPQIRNEWGEVAPGQSFLTRRYRIAEQEIAAERPRVCVGVDLRLAWDPKISDYDPPDWTHPNAAGHAAIAQILKRNPRCMH